MVIPLHRRPYRYRGRSMRRGELLTRLRALRYDLEKLTDEFGLVEGAYHQDTVAEALFQLATHMDL